MNNPMQKIVAWLVLLLGLIIMFLSIYYSYLMFTAKTDFPQVFKQDSAAVQTESPAPVKTEGSQEIGPNNVNVDMQALTQQAMNQAVTSMIPSDTITKFLNIISWSFFSFFLVMAGSYVSGVGIKLLVAKQPAA